MPFQSQKAKLQLSAEDREQLERFFENRETCQSSACRMLLASFLRFLGS